MSFAGRLHIKQFYLSYPRKTVELNIKIRFINTKQTVLEINKPL